jgi:hypothetical protein
MKELGNSDKLKMKPTSNPYSNQLRDDKDIQLGRGSLTIQGSNIWHNPTLTAWVKGRLTNPRHFLLAPNSDWLMGKFKGSNRAVFQRNASRIPAKNNGQINQSIFDVSWKNIWQISTIGGMATKN